MRSTESCRCIHSIATSSALNASVSVGPLGSSGLSPSSSWHRSSLFLSEWSALFLHRLKFGNWDCSRCFQSIVGNLQHWIQIFCKAFNMSLFIAFLLGYVLFKILLQNLFSVETYTKHQRKEGFLHSTLIYPQFWQKYSL